MNATQTRRPVIMGILNVTEDSFSDGGDFFNQEVAVAHAIRMFEEGADIVDVGGESTRPGAERMSAEVQIERVVPVIQAIKQQLPEHKAISIDTTLTEVAQAAVDAGARIINDISAGEDDANIFKLAADNGLFIILMHKQGSPETMQQEPSYDDVVVEVKDYLLTRVETALNSGIGKEDIIIDPGIGFGKTVQHNLELITNLNQLVETGYDVMLGASRKSFMAKLLHTERYKDLLGATSATTTFGVMAGVRYFRVHDVRENRQAADIAFELVQKLAEQTIKSEMSNGKK